MLSTLLLFFALAATGVGTQVASQEARVPGIIDFANDRTEDVLSAPDTVRVGEPFKVTITTFGSGCERKGDTSVIFNATGASVMVYDFTAATHPGVICTAVIKRLPHTVTLRFDKPGEALIQVWGRRVGLVTPPLGMPVVIDHRVTIK